MHHLQRRQPHQDVESFPSCSAGWGAACLDYERSPSDSHAVATIRGVYFLRSSFAWRIPRAGRREVVRAMFSGIVEEIGSVASLVKNDKVKLWDGSEGAGVELTVKANTVLEGATQGCSIAVNGVCLTVTSFNDDEFKVSSLSLHTTVGDKRHHTRVITFRFFFFHVCRPTGHIDEFADEFSDQRFFLWYVQRRVLITSYPPKCLHVCLRMHNTGCSPLATQVFACMPSPYSCVIFFVSECDHERRYLMALPCTTQDDHQQEYAPKCLYACIPRTPFFFSYVIMRDALRSRCTGE